MRLIIDGDACPNKKAIINLAKEYEIEVILITSIAHFSQYLDCTYIVVDNIPQAADLAVINRTQPEDLVITGDYGLAAMVLGRGASAISPRGKIYLEKNIDQMLHRRHVAQKERRRGARVKGPKAYTDQDLQRMLDVLKEFFRRKNEFYGETR